MLLSNWDDLDPEDARRIENDGPGCVVSRKLDGVRAILNVEGGRVRLTSRCVSEVTYHLGEIQDNLTHLKTGLSGLDGTILDGELVFSDSSLDTGRTVARHLSTPPPGSCPPTPNRPFDSKTNKKTASGSTPSTSSNSGAPTSPRYP